MAQAVWPRLQSCCRHTEDLRGRAEDLLEHAQDFREHDQDFGKKGWNLRRYRAARNPRLLPASANSSFHLTIQQALDKARHCRDCDGTPHAMTYLAELRPRDCSSRIAGMRVRSQVDAFLKVYSHVDSSPRSVACRDLLPLLHEVTWS
jgi:hypothetical protein